MDNVEFYNSKLWTIVDILISLWLIFYFLLEKTSTPMDSSAARIRSPPWCELESDHFLQPLLSLSQHLWQQIYNMYVVCITFVHV
jgi:hypothetical protein